MTCWAFSPASKWTRRMRRTHQQRETALCEYCRCAYERSRSDQRFCSAAHRRQYHRDRAINGTVVEIKRVTTLVNGGFSITVHWPSNTHPNFLPGDLAVIAKKGTTP